MPENDKLYFVELKCGTYPSDAPIEIRDKSVKWNKEEVLAGEKIVTDPRDASKQYRLTMAGTMKNPGMIKFDWLYMNNGRLQELTKVTSLRVINDEGETIHDSRQPGVAFQEVYFDDCTNFGLTEELRDPSVVQGYTRFLKEDIEKHSRPNNENYLKVAKRAYNLLKVNGNIEGARTIVALFNSPAAQLSAMNESLSLIAEPHGFELKQFDSQINEFLSFIALEAELFSQDEKASIFSALSAIQEELVTGDRQKIKTYIGTISKTIKEKVNSFSKRFLSENQAFNNINH